MSRLEVAIQHQILWNTGDVILWADLELLLKDASGNFHPEISRVDTGSQVSTMPAFDAKKLDLPIPVAASPVAHQQTGLEVRFGLLRFRVAGLDQTEYVIPTLFLGDPKVLPSG